MRLIQPRPRWIRRVVPGVERVTLPFPVWHVLYRYSHHAGSSGYDRLCDYIGDELTVGPWLFFMGETFLRPWALIDSKLGGQFEYSRYDWVLERALIAALKRSRGALFHALYGEKSLRHATHLAGRRGNRLIATLHHTPNQYDSLFRSTRHLRDLSHAIVMSRHLKPFAETLLDGPRVSVVPHGVDTDYFKPSLEATRDDTPRIAFAGFHQRDYDTLEKAIRIIVGRHPSARVTLLSRDDRCKRIAREHLNRVVQIDRLDDEDYRALLQQSTAMLLPLKMSAAVNVVLEAMACGVPVVTTTGGVDDYVGSEGGIICDIGDAEAMADAVVELCTDQTKLEALRLGARTRATQFAWPAVARATAEVYRRVMES